MKMQSFQGTNDNVVKYVFEWDDCVAESVLYKYGSCYDRTVICCSTQSGCPVGCKFCGTGNKFIRDLTCDEIVAQVQHVLVDKGLADTSYRIQKFQIMFMSMGEPLLNFDNVKKAIKKLNSLHPNADLLISTILPGVGYDVLCDLTKLSAGIPKVGLQFSIHKSNDEDRDKLIPYINKYNLYEIREYGMAWFLQTGRKPYINYCIDGTNNTKEDAERLKLLFSPQMFCFTFSVVCSPKETMKDAGFNNLEVIREFEQSFAQDGYDTRIFDPEGQDDIGGGCGQLWYVQQYYATHSIPDKGEQS